MIMRVLLAVSLALASVDAATRVAVLELGKTGTVRRTTATQAETSAEGVVSFFSALHGYGRKLQHAGMTVVPDLFSRPDSGVVVGLTGVDLDTMPNLNSMMTEEGKNGVVGHLDVNGQSCNSIMSRIQEVEPVVSTTGLIQSFERKAADAGISGMKMNISNEIASDVDAELSILIEKLSAEAANEGKTVILHVIVEEDDGAARRRKLSRRLQDEDEEEEEADGDNQDNGDNADGQDNANQQNNGYYGYGYYNAYGEWVTPYKTMFQIQYFNVVLWTSLGLVVILLFSIYLMIYMPLMADTLLFGEQARSSMDD